MWLGSNHCNAALRNACWRRQIHSWIPIAAKAQHLRPAASFGVQSEWTSTTWITDVLRLRLHGGVCIRSHCSVGILHAIFGAWWVYERCWLDTSNEYNPSRTATQGLWFSLEDAISTSQNSLQPELHTDLSCRDSARFEPSHQPHHGKHSGQCA